MRPNSPVSESQILEPCFCLIFSLLFFLTNSFTQKKKSSGAFGAKTTRFKMSNMTTEVGKRSLTVPLLWVWDDWQEASCYCIQLWYERAAENCEKSGGE